MLPAGLLVGVAYAIQTYRWTPGKCDAGHCVGEVLDEMLLPFVAKAAAGALVGLLLAAACIVLLRIGRRAA